MPFIFVREVVFRRFRLFRVDCNTTDEVSVSVGRAWYVFPSWSEGCLLCVVGTKDNRQLSMVNPTLLPIDFWLVSSKPWIP